MKAKRHECAWPIADCVKCESVDYAMFDAFDILSGFTTGVKLAKMGPRDMANVSKSILKLSKDFETKSQKWIEWQKRCK